MSEINTKQIQFSVLGVFIVIFGLLIWFLNTDYYIEKDYLDFKEVEFKTVLLYKKDEHPIKGNEIGLKSGQQLRVYRDLFDKLEIGDSIIKRSNSDSIYFYTSRGLIIDDYNEFKRDKYLKTLE